MAWEMFEARVCGGEPLDAVTIDEDTLENLPVLDRDFIATMSRFIDPGSLGNGGVTIVQNRASGPRLSSS
jgi:hypothetical protein